MVNRKHRVALAAGLAATCLVLTAGCGGSSSDETSDTSTEKSGDAGKGKGKGGKNAAPLLTVAEANKIVDTYQALNNEANAKLSPALIAKVEAGAMLAFDKGYFTQASGLDQKNVKANLAAFVYVNRAFYIPPAAANTDWFMVRAQGAELKDGKPGAPWTTGTRFIVFKHTADGWRAVNSQDFSGDEQKKIPEIALDADGLARVAEPTAKIGGTAPADLADLVADLYVTGGADTPLARTKARENAISAYNNRLNGLDGHAYNDYKKAAPRVGTTYALRTKDGGALVLNDSAVDETSLAKDLTSYITLGKRLKPFVKKGASDHMYQVVNHEMQMEVGVIAPSGTPAVYGLEQQTTSVDATPMSTV
ncbi:hypothetical protein [Streptomyces sp. NPDC008139]|uniref:hypothetical protein n=1 Tax=Streptomyces sp. NPDC008139 TaxID=3364814 RepID=UPI0036E719A7